MKHCRFFHDWEWDHSGETSYKVCLRCLKKIEYDWFESVEGYAYCRKRNYKKIAKSIERKQRFHEVKLALIEVEESGT